MIGALVERIRAARPPHRDLWDNAASYTDVCELTAQWIEGRAIAHPGYGRFGPHYGPDEETAEIALSLAELNRAGFLTQCSQPGCVEDDGAYEQRAAVEGYCDSTMVRALRAAATEAGLLARFRLIRGGSLRGRFRALSDMIPASRIGEEVVTHFGVWQSRRDIECVWPWIPDDRIDEIVARWQVTLVDPQWGRQHYLWLKIRAALADVH